MPPGRIRNQSLATSASRNPTLPHRKTLVPITKPRIILRAAVPPVPVRISDAAPVRIAATTAVMIVVQAAIAGRNLVVDAAVLAAVADAVAAGVPVPLLAGETCRPPNTLHRKAAARNRAAIHVETISAIRGPIVARNPGALSPVAAKSAASTIAALKHLGTAELLRTLQVPIRPKSRFSFLVNRWRNIAASHSAPPHHQ